MLPESAKQALQETLEANSELNGVAIAYYGNEMCSVWSNGNPDSPNYSVRYIIVEVSSETGSVVSDSNAIEGFTKTPLPTGDVVSSRVKSELASAGLTCVFAAASAAEVFFGAAATPATGGASALLVVVGWTGMVTGGLQCINGIARTVLAATGNIDDLNNWDNDPIYRWTTNIVGWAGLGAGITQVANSAPKLYNLIRSRNLLPSSFRNMNHAARGNAMKRAIDRVVASPGGKEAVEEALTQAGFSPQQIAKYLRKPFKGMSKPQFNAISTSLRGSNMDEILKGLKGNLQFALEQYIDYLKSNQVQINVHIINRE